MKKRLFIFVVFAVLTLNSFAQDAYIGEIRMFAGNFAPKNWAFCDGSTLAISQNTALFSILDTTYGGDGTTNFGLPDFRGRVVVGAGQGAGLNTVELGEKGGPEQVNITPNEGRMYQTQAPYCGINFIICLYGIFPPRN